MLNATAPVHGSIKYGKKAQARKIAPSGSFDPEAARHHQRPGMSRPRAAAGSNEPDGAILRACAFLPYLIDSWTGAVAFSTIAPPNFAPDGHMHAARTTPR